MKTITTLLVLTAFTLTACGGPSGIGIGKDSQRRLGTVSTQPTPSM